mgnify:CR=1 FL=1
MRVKVRCERITTWWHGSSEVRLVPVAQHSSDLAGYVTDPPFGALTLTYRAKTDHGLTAGSSYYVTTAAQSGGPLDLDRIDNLGTGDQGVLSVVSSRSAAPGPSSGTVALIAVDGAWGSSSAVAWSLSIASA